MGTPKEWLDVDGEPMLTRVVRIVGAVFSPVIVAARPGQTLPPFPVGVEVVLDRVADVGPLAGIEAALSSLEGRTDAAFITGCDHPFLTQAFLRQLAEALEDDAAAVPGEFWGRLVPPLLQLSELTRRDSSDHVPGDFFPDTFWESPRVRRRLLTPEDLLASHRHGIGHTGNGRGRHFAQLG